MFIFDHLFDVFILLLLALLIFGPRKMIQMGTDLGRAFRQLRESTKGISWSDMLTGNFDEAASAQPHTPPSASTSEATSTPYTPPPPGNADSPMTSSIVESTLASDEEPRLR